MIYKVNQKEAQDAVEAVEERREHARLGAARVVARAVADERVDLVKEEDAGRRRVGRLERAPHGRLGLAEVRRVDVRARERYERASRLVRARAREERLRAARRPVEEDAAARPQPELGELGALRDRPNERLLERELRLGLRGVKNKIVRHGP